MYTSLSLSIYMYIYIYISEIEGLVSTVPDGEVLQHRQGGEDERDPPNK